MANPNTKSTVTIGENKFNAVSTQVGATTLHDHAGMPQMGTVAFSISITADMHDNANLPFSVLQNLFSLANVVTRDKVKDVKIEFWADETMQDALCVYSFRGWISSFFTLTNENSNHLVSLTLQPVLDAQQFAKVTMSN
ncbi:hypothetical protein [Terriglobus sp.]|uniref:hypothetical protein n=1 Tax=Terriglobus sp. TaxID=1889013 RepID=UPI003B00C9CF